MGSLRGQLLVSAGGLFDPNFRHTVVLIAEHGEDGAVGVILNRPMEVSVAEAAPPLADLVEPGESLYQGGPVEPAGAVLLAEFAHPDLADVLAFGAVGFVVGEVSEVTGAAILRARIYAGHAGWGPGQLEAEMEEDAWLVEPAREEDVFTDAPELLWSRVVARMGPEYERLSKMPFDPSMN